MAREADLESGSLGVNNVSRRKPGGYGRAIRVRLQSCLTIPRVKRKQDKEGSNGRYQSAR